MRTWRFLTICTFVALSSANCLAERTRLSPPEGYSAHWERSPLLIGSVTTVRAPSTSQLLRSPVLAVEWAQAERSDGAIAAQRVFLYEENQASPYGTRFAGSAIWRAERTMIDSNQKSNVVVRADIEIPELKVSVQWALRRNDDKQLPASHTMEIMFKLPSDFPHSGISNVPGILMKQSETARGVPLNGVAVKVTANFFLIGLSSAAVDANRNSELLKERSWLDIPVVYSDGKRAIIAVEKGIPGERAFAEAFDAWGITIFKAGPAAAPPPPPLVTAPRSTVPTATSGTGFFVATNGRVLTNSHVVDQCRQIRIRGSDRNATAQLLSRDTTNDLALLSTDLPTTNFAVWHTSTREGEDATVYGFPFTGILASAGNVTKGIVAAIAGLRDDARYLQISAQVQPGNSGGPVFDATGAVIGVVVSRLNQIRSAGAMNEIAQNVNFAIKSSVASTFLNAHGVSLSEGRVGRSLSTPEIVERAKAITVQVYCER
jgi:S1-C subfamily serine protease